MLWGNYSERDEIELLILVFFQTCGIALLACLIFSTTLYALIVVPPGGFHFNINGLLVCEPYFISNNVLALAACLFYFPTTMILMYCYGTIFHSDKVKVRYKKAVLTSLPFVRASGGSEENANKMAERVRFFFFFGMMGYLVTRPLFCANPESAIFQIAQQIVAI